MVITASNPVTTTPPITGKNTSPENNKNITEDTQEVPKRNNKLGLSCAKLSKLKASPPELDLAASWLEVDFAKK